MEMNWLEDFISLASTGSFSKAAEQRNISQSAFSRRIHTLEDWLGTTLVDRHTHPVSLTDAGIQLIATAKQVIRIIYQTREDFGYRENTRPRTLSLGVADHLAIHFVPDWLMGIRPLLNGSKIQLVTGLRAGLGFVELLKTQDLDFLLAYSGSVSKVDHESGMFQSLTLGKDELLPVCHKDLRPDPSYHFPGVHDRPVLHIGYMPPSALATLVNQESVEHIDSIYLRTIIETGAVETIKALVMKGFGMAWIPRTAIQEELKLGLLSELGNASHRIPFNIKLFRNAANTRSDIMTLWDNLKTTI